MPLNIPGTLVPFQLLFHPRLVIPSLIVKDIRQLDFVELRKAGYRGAVFDKDNCLTLSNNDQLIPELKEAWRECREVFGDGNILIVSNSAGTRIDPAGVQAESVSHHLSVPVLHHRSLKPSYSCISSIRKYFTSLPKPIRDEELIVVGDRIFTDVVMANRMSRQHAQLLPGLKKPPLADEKRTSSPRRLGPLSIWTDGIWERESMLARSLEKRVLQSVQKWIVGSNGVDTPELGRFLKEVVEPEVAKDNGFFRRLWDSTRRK